MTSETIHSLSKKVYSEPTGVELKPYLLRYIRYYADQAMTASDNELLHGEIGFRAASSICGALAWQGAHGVEGDDWITPESEPLLSEMRELSSALDADTNHLEVWRKLFETYDKLSLDS